MLKFVYKVILTVNSMLLLVSVYLIQAQIVPKNLKCIPNIVFYSGYVFVPIVLSFCCLVSARLLSKDSIEGGICDIEEANNSYLPSYLGYFFVALGVSDNITLLFVFAILFIFSFHSQTVYFNPLFLLWGYKFYYIKLQDGRKIFVVTKREIVVNEGIVFKNLRRINYFTFIDMEKYR